MSRYRYALTALALLALSAATPAAAQAADADPAQQAADAAVALAPFAGGWAKHGYSLVVLPNGDASADWRTYQWCKDPGIRPPCDSIVDDMIKGGGHARMTFSSVEGQTALGIMSERTDMPAGWSRPVTLTLRPDGLALLAWGDAAAIPPSEQRPVDGTVLCRPDAWQTEWCGA